MKRDDKTSLSMGLQSGKWTWLESFRQRAVVNAPLLVPRCMVRPIANTVGILMYHRIATSLPGLPFPTSNVTPDRFRDQLQGLLRFGYKPWPLRRILEYHTHRRAIPEKVFVVTLDDGYENNFTVGLPILRDLSIPATMFICTAYLDRDTPFPFEDWQPKPFQELPESHWRPLRSYQVESMIEEGIMEIGTHTHTHSDFRSAPDRLFEDLALSQRVLRDRFGQAQSTFAFPYGKTKRGFAGKELAESARRAGVLCGLTSDHALTQVHSDPFAWGRVAVTQADHARSLRAKLDGRYFQLGRTWNSLRRR
jgi:peptidoglycan/xylan/chitin deacetylase (PgdA/CDA1 family)